MKIACLGDENTVTGMRLAGVVNSKVAGEGGCREAFMELTGDAGIGVIIITERLADTIRSDIDKWRHDHTFPVIIEIPDKGGPIPGRTDPIRDLIKRAVGIENIAAGGRDRKSENYQKEES
ncbi:MAG: hypothetical protein CVT48_03295 [Thermoplasmata archaeon HGW-Thermoplasmata-1]|nr:MAG: hypothetical protein CVT48_03295 [Thermoplasmata archaeon HGW-Thermoplasmata-1]